MKKKLTLLLALLCGALPAMAEEAREAGARLTMTVAGMEYAITLEDNAAARSLLAQLPLTLTFEDFNGTEKIAYPPEGLDIADAPTRCDPVVGTLAYYVPWGNLCIFYRDFRASENLVPLGQVEGDFEALSVLADGFDAYLEAAAAESAAQMPSPMPPHYSAPAHRRFSQNLACLRALPPAWHPQDRRQFRSSERPCGRL